jgi:Primase C terminal 1 (PriCT-1)
MAAPQSSHAQEAADISKLGIGTMAKNAPFGDWVISLSISLAMVFVAPPSHGLRGNYEFIQGGLDDIARLPALANLPPHLYRKTETPRPSAVAAAKSDEGATKNAEGRNNILFEHCLRHARCCDDFNALLDVARTRNADFTVPLDDAEAVKTAHSAWGYEERGENFISVGQRTIISTEIAERILMHEYGREALALFLKLSHAHGSRHGPFAIQPQAMADAKVIPCFGTSKHPYVRGRKALLEIGIVKQIHWGRHKGDPNLYLLPPRKN